MIDTQFTDEIEFKDARPIDIDKATLNKMAAYLQERTEK